MFRVIKIGWVRLGQRSLTRRLITIITLWVWLGGPLSSDFAWFLRYFPVIFTILFYQYFRERYYNIHSSQFYGTFCNYFSIQLNIYLYSANCITLFILYNMLLLISSRKWKFNFLRGIVEKTHGHKKSL